MKVAGRKNDGAWFRTNAVITELTGTDKSQLITKIDELPSIDAAYNSLVAMMAEVGVSGILHAQNTQEWATSLVHDGIPHQIWIGRLSWTTYTKRDTTALLGKKKYKFEANYQGEISRFARDLRKCLKDYLMARRQARDLFNSGTRAQGNVGGFPNASKNE